MNQSLFFDKDSAIIIAAIYKEQLIFKKVSKNFKLITYYKEEEVLNNPLTLLMPKKQR
jgi:hypothetical protein